MSRHLGKIIDIIKNEEGFKIPKISDNKDENQKKFGWRELKQHFKDGNDISEEEYIGILSNDYDNLNTSWLNSYAGGYGGSEDEDDDKRIGDIINQSKHNNHVVNSKLLERIKKEKDILDEDEFEEWNDDILSHLAKRGVLSGQDINDFLEGKYRDPELSDYNKILENPNITPQHIEKFVEMRPNEIDEALRHPKFDEKSLERLINKESMKDKIDDYFIDQIVSKTSEGYDRRSNAIPNEEQKLNLNPRVINNILENHSDEVRNSNLGILLDHAEPTFKKQWTDEKLGITDGSYGHTEPKDHDSDESFQADNWSNWATGDKANKNIMNYLAGSRHLDDDQAEHIKRHGDIDDKYALYHNDKVDPKHGVEMFQKWHDDDDHHGYDAQELQDQYKHHKDDIYTLDDLDESVVEDIREEIWDSGDTREAAEENYSFDSWVSDNEDNLSQKIELTDEHLDEIAEKMHEDYDDWDGENPDFHQHSGNPDYVALNKLNDAFNDEHITLEELKNTTGIKEWSKLGLEPDTEGDVHTNEVLDTLNEKFNGPETIDYSNHDKHNISEHPKFDDRFEETANEFKKDKLSNSPYDFYEDFYEDYMGSEEYLNAENEAVNNEVKYNAKEHMNELYDNSHQDTRFIPNHLHTGIPNFEQLHAENKRKIGDGGNADFFNSQIKDRDYEHHYGEDQHFYEMVRDHSEANNGSIDIGTMNKLYPNQKEKWKKIFGGKGKISSDEISQSLESLPKTKYDISYGKWGGGNIQNINGKDQIVFRLDHSIDSLKPLMEDPEVYNTFKKVQGVSKQSGHPTKDNTIAWARVDASDPEHWMIDEVQSDFGKTVSKYLRNEGGNEKADHVDKISNHHKNWRENITNAILKEAKKHGTQKVSTHSPESKARHTSSDTIHSVYKDSYKKVPRSMGFQPSSHEGLPLTDKGRENFQTEDSPESGGGMKELGGHTFNLTPKLLKKHMDDSLEYLEALEKGDISRAAKGLLVAGALAHGAHTMYGDPQTQAAKKFTQDNTPKHARSISSIDHREDPFLEGNKKAEEEVEGMVYRSDKKRFLNKYHKGLSHHVYKQTVKGSPELNQKYGFINKLSSGTFKEVIDKNQNLKDDVHKVHYDKLHSEFDGDHEKMLHAWQNGIKNTHEKFRKPANMPELGEKASPDDMGEPLKKVPKTI